MLFSPKRASQGHKICSMAFQQVDEVGHIFHVAGCYEVNFLHERTVCTKLTFLLPTQEPGMTTRQQLTTEYVNNTDRRTSYKADCFASRRYLAFQSTRKHIATWQKIIPNQDICRLLLLSLACTDHCLPQPLKRCCCEWHKSFRWENAILETAEQRNLLAHMVTIDLKYLVYTHIFPHQSNDLDGEVTFS